MSEVEQNKEELSQYLTFVLDNEEYGVPILTVRGIQGWEKTTPIPNSPDYVMGIINLRGEVVPIVDLRRRFGLEVIPYGAHTVVVVVRIEEDEKQRTVGLVVDAVADVHDISEENMRSTPEFGARAENEFVKGLGLFDDKMIIILEINNLVDWQRLPSGDQESRQSGSVDGAKEINIAHAEPAI